MKVTVDGRELPGVRVGDWTFEEALKVKALTGLRVGQVMDEYLQGDAAVGLAFAIVGEMRLGNPPDHLLRTANDRIVIDFREPAAEEEPGGPPVVAADGSPGASRGGGRSRRRS